MGFSQAIDSHFLISERGSTICTELRAGLASFLTLSYLLLVNPMVRCVELICVERSGVTHYYTYCMALLLNGMFRFLYWLYMLAMPILTYYCTFFSRIHPSIRYCT
jgi:AGZA family xanthine/uracil permease-like MFS transporter